MSGSISVFYGVEIPESLLAIELQNHDAASLKDARVMAGRALATKAVLLARADALDLQAVPERNARGQDETEEEARIRVILSEEVDIEPPSETRLLEIYEAQPDGFLTPPLIEASHILISPVDQSEAASQNALDEAVRLIAELQVEPGRFERIAASKSSCPSASEGGLLGQLRPGDVLASIWESLATLAVGEIAAHPVETEHGWHVLRLDHKAASARLPFEHVRPHISAQVEARAWTIEAARYVDGLLAKSASSPGLKLNELGDLDDGLSGSQEASALLGAVLGNVANGLEALSERSRGIVGVAAASQNAAPETILKRAIGGFLNGADDEAWTKIVSRLRDSDAPLRDCLDVIVAHGLPPLKAKHTLILQPGGRAASVQEKGHAHGNGK